MPREKTIHAMCAVHCKASDEEYVGETLQAIGVRKKEHEDAICLGEEKKSAIAEHIYAQETP